MNNLLYYKKEDKMKKRQTNLFRIRLPPFVLGVAQKYENLN